MWLPLSAIAALCVLFDISDATRADNELELMFRGRSHSDWQEAWHKEKYTRCRETLIRHLYWACDKDIYRLARRSNGNTYLRQTDKVKLDFPWFAPARAKRLLRSRRRAGSTITSECCKSSGCTWEEYAEYCPTNKRYTNYV